jgi:hypothetical protein
VKATDAADNTGAAASYTWTVDTAAPAASITASPTNPSNSSAPSFSFSSEAGASFQCALDGASFAGCTSPKSYTGVVDGSHTFQVKASDAAGTTGAAASYTWTIDTGAPAASITANPTNPSNNASPSFSFSSEAGASFQCALDGASFAACSSPKSYSSLADGSHTFQVKASDAAGNTGTAASYTWTIDTVAATASITASPTNPSTSSSASFSFSSEAGATFQCAIDGAAFAACASPKSYTGLADGSHTFQVKATDAAGNTGAAASYTWTIDTSAPTATIGTSPSNPSNSSSPSFSFSSEAGATFQCALDGASFAACTSPKSYTGVADGSHTFQVKATDAAGNTGAAASYTWTIDTVGATASITASPANPSTSSSASFSFSSEAGATFQCALDGSSFTACMSPKSYTSLADGSHTFQVKATDTVGNTGTAVGYTWSIDTVGAAASITASPTNPSTSSAPSFSFTSEAGATFQCALDGASFAACTSPKSYTGVADGSHTFQVKATDTAGNTGAAASYTWTIDTVGATATITANPTNPSTSSAPSFSFSSEAGATFQCALDGSSFAACTSPKSYTGVADGSHTFQVKATDTAGNTGAAASYTWTIDTVGATATITASPTNPSNSSSASFSFSSEAGATFQCSLDSAFTACASPKSYSGIADGSHTFQVKATDTAGNTGAAASYTWTIDTAAPDTSITASPPASTNSTSASFSFTSTEPSGASYACALDGSAFSSCVSAKSYSGLADGSHTFQVKATDQAGNADATPATYTWSVDSTPPDTSIVTKPTNPTNATNATFTFTSTEGGSTFQCALDGAAFSACTSPQTYAGPLANGSHTFQVKATDAVGNADATAASYTWTVDTAAPDTTITSSPTNPTSSTSATFAFSATETGSTFQCQLDGGALGACTSPTSYSGLATGSHTFQVKATDAAGNVDLTPASFTWTISAAPTVTSTAPVSGATGVATSVAPTATFSTAMNASTITAASFTLTPSGGSAVAATVAYNSGTLTATLTPSAALTASTTYTAKLDTTVKSSSNVALASNYTWTFTTAAAGGPTVTSVTPPNGQTGVDRAYKPTATFSTDMNAATITTSSFTLKDPAGVLVAATVAYNSATRTATLTPNRTMAALTTFTARLMTTITSSTGTPLAAVYQWNFQTSSPSVATTYPTNGAFLSVMSVAATSPILSGPVADITPWTPIEVGFSEDMDPLTINSTTFVLLDPSGAPIAGTMYYDAVNFAAIFTPTYPLKYGKTYTVQLTTAILAALDGAPLTAPVSWQFTTTLNGAPIGVNSGAPEPNYYVSAAKALFLPDRYFSGGTTRTTTNPIAGTLDPALYQDERVGLYSYTLPVPDGSYDIKLHFAETEFTAAGQRVFNVDVAETTAVPDVANLDIYGAVGANTALVRTIQNVAAGTGPGPGFGTIHITASAVVGEPVISAIELIPLAPTVTVMSPLNGATGVARTVAIKGTFSQAMDPVTITAATVTVAGPSGVPIAATVSYATNSRIMTINPSTSLLASTRYTVQIGAAVKTLAGMKFATPPVWSFTTGTK